MRRMLRSEGGQASVEYLLVGLVLVSLMGALAALWRFISSGGLTRLIESNASHAMGSIGGICDALFF